MAALSPEKEASILEVILSLVDGQRYNLMTSTTLLVYDHMLTFADEVNVVWKLGINWISCLFFITRYAIPLFFIVENISIYPMWTIKNCEGFMNSNFSLLCSAFILGLASWIMILRTYVLYNRKLWVLLFLAGLWLSMMASMLLVGLVVGGKVNLPPSLIVITRLCLMGKNIERKSALYYVGIIVLDSTIFIMMLRKIKTYKDNRAVAPSGLQLLKIVFNDGTLYFAISLLIHLINFMFVIFGDDAYKTLPGSYSQSISGIAICRLVLRLRKEGERRKWHGRRQRYRAQVNAAARPSTAPDCPPTSLIESFFNGPQLNDDWNEDDMILTKTRERSMQIMTRGDADADYYEHERSMIWGEPAGQYQRRPDHTTMSLALSSGA